MAHGQEMKAVFKALVGSIGGGSVSGVTYDTFPDDDDISLTAHTDAADTEGDFVEIVSSIGSADIWFVGYYVSMGLNPGGFDAKVTWGTGTSGSETGRAVFPLAYTGTVTTVVPSLGAYYSIPFAIFVPNGSREAGRVKVGNAAADTVQVVSHHALGVGT